MIAAQSLARHLEDARRAAEPITQLTAHTPLTVDDAYAVQRAVVALRRATGESVVGVKLGFTSTAKARQMGVHDVIVGVLTSGMAVGDGDVLDVSKHIHARIEPELAFRLAVPLQADAPATVSHVAPAMEVIDSRYRDFQFTLADVVADNTSASHFVIGQWVPLDAVRSLDNLGVIMEIDGQIVDTGSTAAILGNPLRALDAVRRLTEAHGIALPTGSIVLAGAATAAHQLPRQGGSTVVASVTGLGRVTVTTGGCHV